MRGFFGIGIERLSKSGNMGNLIRTAHAFGAAFTFAINPYRDPVSGTTPVKHFADTAKSFKSLPFYTYDTLAEANFPTGVRLVGVELVDDAHDLPVFHHPPQAAYILGGERYTLSDEILDACDVIVRIPTKFSLNVATAGAIVMYDRLRASGAYGERALMTGQKLQEKPAHIHGGPLTRRRDNAP